MAGFGLAQARLMIGGRGGKTAADDNAGSIAVLAVTDRTIDVEALATALEHSAGQRKRYLPQQDAVLVTRDEGIVRRRLAPCHGMRRGRTRGGPVAEKRRGVERTGIFLPAHIAAAARRRGQRRHADKLHP